MLLALSLLGCVTPTDPAPSQEGPEPLAQSTQYELLDDIVAAEATSEPRGYHEVRARWQGQRLLWEVAILPLLCASPRRCNVLPFDGAQVAGVIRQGWLPKLNLDEEGFERLSTLCAPHEACVLTVEGTLNTFRFSPEDYTQVAFDDVTVLAARQARSDERWGSSHGARSDLSQLRQRGSQLRAQGMQPTLRVQGGEER
ncbi:MAG: hypothetical protein KTR31_13290 [Myxococcales bacterium]|nr:hypothetical protein [Myxococcales bacterium]